MKNRPAASAVLRPDQLGEAAIEFPPMQASASFNLARVKEKSVTRSG
jgi:hypothetical protein